MQPAQYWRQSKDWSTWLGREGTVIGSTQVRVAAPERSALTPYAYVLIDFGSERRSFMGVGHQPLQVGDRVRCVLRKTAVTDKNDLIAYGIRVEKMSVPVSK